MNKNQNGKSPVLLNLANWVRGQQVSFETLDTFRQFGYVDRDLGGNLLLAPTGRQALKENGLA